MTLLKKINDWKKYPNALGSEAQVSVLVGELAAILKKEIPEPVKSALKTLALRGTMRDIAFAISNNIEPRNLSVPSFHKVVDSGAASCGISWTEAVGVLAQYVTECGAQLPPAENIPITKTGEQMRKKNYLFFDSYIFVDWSSRNSLSPHLPTADSVWIGQLIRNQNGEHLCNQTYHRSRSSGFNYVKDFLIENIKNNRRVLVGFDFPYGYPNGFSTALELQQNSQIQPWNLTWGLLANKVTDNNDNMNNRFVAAGNINTICNNGNGGPFWGCPHGANYQNLFPLSPGYPFNTVNNVPLNRLRIVENRLNGVQETWKLFGNGSVGSQSLTGIPYLYQLRNHHQLANLSKVWPFETGFTNNPNPQKNSPFILHAEIWPGLVNEDVINLVENNPELIRDRAQVQAMCNWAASNDENNTLGQFFNPNNLEPNEVSLCTQEEGWILGQL